jgi:hypothetical protein
MADGVGWAKRGGGQPFEQIRPEHYIYRGKIRVNNRAMERVDSVWELRNQMAEGGKVRNDYIADAIAQVCIAESLPTDRIPAFSM